MSILHALTILEESLNMPQKVKQVQEIFMLDLKFLFKNYHRVEKSFIYWSLSMEQNNRIQRKETLV